MSLAEQSLVAIIEDDADAAFLLRRLLQKIEVPHHVEHLDDGEKALNFLTARFDAAAINESPDLILLDIKMPKLNGFEVLEWIRSKAHLAVPVIVMTTSDDPNDQQRALDLGADAFVSKFPSTADFRELVTRLLRTNAAV
jgi:CheY-like chemotaxis protein